MLIRHRTVSSLLHGHSIFHGWDIPGLGTVAFENPGPMTSFWAALGGRHV